MTPQSTQLRVTTQRITEGMYMHQTHQLDTFATKKRVEEELQRYREVKKRQEITRLLLQPTATIRLHEKDYTETDYLVLMESVLATLSNVQIEFITYKYMENCGKNADYVVQEKLVVSERTYYRIKSKTLLMIGEALQLNQYEDHNK